MRTIIVCNMYSPLTEDKPAPGTEGSLSLRIASESLFGTPPAQRREVLIVHNGREYRLRLTQSGKMILTA
jgi:hemin uptake protein HemP